MESPPIKSTMLLSGKGSPRGATSPRVSKLSSYYCGIEIDQLRTCFLEKYLSNRPLTAADFACDKFGPDSPLTQLLFTIASDLVKMGKVGLCQLGRLLNAKVITPDDCLVSRNDKFFFLTECGITGTFDYDHVPRILNSEGLHCREDFQSRLIALDQILFCNLTAEEQAALRHPESDILERYYFFCINQGASSFEEYPHIYWYNLAVYLKPDAPFAYKRIMEQLFLPLQLREKYLDAWLATDPENIEALCRKGLCRIESDNPASAITYFTIAIDRTKDKFFTKQLSPEKTNQSLFSLYFYRGQANYAIDQPAKALDDYQSAIEINPENKDVSKAYNLCLNILKGLKNHGPIRSWIKFAENYQGSKEALSFKSDLHLLLGERTHALLSLQSIIKIDPRDPEALEKLAKLEAKNSKYVDALSYLDQAQQYYLSPNDKARLKILKIKFYFQMGFSGIAQLLLNQISSESIPISDGLRWLESSFDKDDPPN